MTRFSSLLVCMFLVVGSPCAQTIRTDPSLGCRPDEARLVKGPCRDWDHALKEMEAPDCAPAAPIGNWLITCPRWESYRWVEIINQCRALDALPKTECSDGLAMLDLLRVAMWAGDLETTEWLLDLRAPVEAHSAWSILVSCGKSSRGSKTLSREQCAGMVDLLVKHGFDINDEYMGNTFVGSAAGSGNVTMTEIALQHGADPNKGGTRCESMLDLVSAHEGDRTTADLMEKYGAHRRNIFTKMLCRVDELRAVSH